MATQGLLPGIIGNFTQEHIVGFIFRPYFVRNGNIYRPKRAKVFRIPVFNYK